jgi:hypothetical protein
MFLEYLLYVDNFGYLMYLFNYCLHVVYILLSNLHWDNFKKVDVSEKC